MLLSFSSAARLALAASSSCLCCSSLALYSISRYWRSSSALASFSFISASRFSRAASYSAYLCKRACSARARSSSIWRWWASIAAFLSASRLAAASCAAFLSFSINSSTFFLSDAAAFSADSLCFNFSGEMFLAGVAVCCTVWGFMVAVLSWLMSKLLTGVESTWWARGWVQADDFSSLRSSLSGDSGNFSGLAEEASGSEIVVISQNSA